MKKLDILAVIIFGAMVGSLNIILLMGIFFRKKHKYSRISLFPSIITLALTFIILALNMWYYIFHLKDDKHLFPFISVSALMLVYAAYVFHAVSLCSRYERKSVELEQQAFYNKCLEKTLDSLKRFRHGYINNLNVLFSYAALGEYGKMLGYFHEVMEHTGQLEDAALLNIRNAGLYGVISSKLRYAEELGVRFTIETESEVREIKNIWIADLCEMMGILLDNAIEAAAESKDRTVLLQIQENEEAVVLKVRNSFSVPPDPEKIYFKGYSTKGEDRGMGLWIVREIVRSNRFVINNAYQDEELFCQEVIIRKTG